GHPAIVSLLAVVIGRGTNLCDEAGPVTARHGCACPAAGFFDDAQIAPAVENILLALDDSANLFHDRLVRARHSTCSLRAVRPHQRKLHPLCHRTKGSARGGGRCRGREADRCERRSGGSGAEPALLEAVSRGNLAAARVPPIAMLTALQRPRATPAP